MEKTENGFIEFLWDAIAEFCDGWKLEPTIRTFYDAGLLTNNNGLVVKIGDSEFHVTVQKVK